MFVATDSHHSQYAHSLPRAQTAPKAQVAKHFTGRTYRSVDWSQQAFATTGLGFVLGGLTSAFSIPFVAALATLAVVVWFLTGEEFEPGLNAWLQRVNLWVTAGFYGLLGSLFGMAAFAGLPVLFFWMRRGGGRA